VITGIMNVRNVASDLMSDRKIFSDVRKEVCDLRNLRNVVSDDRNVESDLCNVRNMVTVSDVRIVRNAISEE